MRCGWWMWNHDEESQGWTMRCHCVSQPGPRDLILLDWCLTPAFWITNRIILARLLSCGGLSWQSLNLNGTTNGTDKITVGKPDFAVAFQDGLLVAERSSLCVFVLQDWFWLACSGAAVIHAQTDNYRFLQTKFDYRYIVPSRLPERCTIKGTYDEESLLFS